MSKEKETKTEVKQTATEKPVAPKVAGDKRNAARRAANAAKKAAPEPNAIFTGKVTKINKNTGKTETVPAEIPKFYIDGTTKIPAGEEWRKRGHIPSENFETVRQLSKGAVKDLIKK